MKHHIYGYLWLVLTVALFTPSELPAGAPNGDTSEWHIKDIYNYLSEAGEDLPDEDDWRRMTRLHGVYAGRGTRLPCIACFSCIFGYFR